MGLTFSWPFLMEKVYHHFAVKGERDREQYLVNKQKEHRALTLTQESAGRGGAHRTSKERLWRFE